MPHAGRIEDDYAQAHNQRAHVAARAHSAALLGHETAVVARLQAELHAQARVIREQEAALAHSRKIFEGAAATAKIGVWECDLDDETLRWTDGVYDMFGIPRGSPLNRNEILPLYSPESLAALQRVRSQAIADCGGFTLDAQITTPQGHCRWIRLTATVETENGTPVRIFGMKQDITEEKLLTDRIRYLAEFDPMTGLANRTRFQARLADLCAQPAECPGGALLLIDLDGFKQVNDTLGHALGDECLRETALRLSRICREADLVARIGGDEFAVLVAGHADPHAIEALAAAIVEALSQPIELSGHSPVVGASVGIARCKDFSSAELFKQADTALYAAKAAGRNRFQVFGRHMV